MEEAKKTQGRQKREIKKIAGEKDLFTTFTKRKSGIYKKASELATLCGARVDVLIFSPTGKTFCYGEPSLQSITKRPSNQFLQDPTLGDIHAQLLEDQRRSDIQELNEKNDELMDQLYVEKEREKELGEILKTRNGCGWWEAKMEELSHEQAREMEASLMELHKKLEREISIKCGGDNASSLVGEGEGSSSSVALASGNTVNGSDAVFDSNLSEIDNFLDALAVTDQTNGVSDPFFTCASGSNYMPEVGFGANNIEAHESASAIASLPNNQAWEVNLTGSSGSGSHAHAFSPSNGHQGANPFLYYASNENGGFSFPPFNGYGHGYF